MTKLHNKVPVHARGNVRYVPGTTLDGLGDYIETVHDANGALVLRVHGESEQEAAELAEFVVLAINRFKKVL